MAWELVRRPIGAVDTDLWFHLNAGRYIAQHRAVPHEVFFSFLTPPRPWVDYSWLFQLAVYLTYVKWGYVGLILLRGLCFLATIAAVWLVVRDTGRARRPQEPSALGGWPALLLALYALVLSVRVLNVRPHLVTYLMIPVLLWVLEARPRWGLACLPLLALLWCNLHGLLFPVMLLIIGAYTAEHALEGWRRTAPRWDARLLGAAAASLLAVGLTPNGLALVQVVPQALGAIGYMPAVINEFRPMPVERLLQETFSFTVAGGVPAHATVLNLLLLCSAASLLLGAWTRRLRVSHALLWLGGAVLWVRGQRFAYEFVLLSAPLLAAHPLLPSMAAGKGRLPAPAAWALGALALAAVGRGPAQWLGPVGRFPFTPAGLPQGIVMFLQQLGAGGTVLNSPNPGGYLQWTLGPAHPIFMAMQVPFPFTEQDLYVGANMFSDRGVLRKVLAAHRPAFIIAPQEADQFYGLIREHPQYVPIFFDDAAVLYVDRGQHPDIAQQHALRGVDPWRFAGKDLETVLDLEDHVGLREPLLAILRVYPECLLANLLLAGSYYRTAEYEPMLRRTQAVVAAFPEATAGYWLMGKAYEALGQTGQALRAYQRGLRRADASEQPRFYAAIGSAHFAQGRYPQAYRAFARGVNRFAASTPVKTLYELATAAQRAGHGQTAEALFTYLLDYRLGDWPQDQQWRERILEQQD